MTSPVIKAKPTTYNNTRFRSRLEARWASFFDAIEREWVYEPSTPEVRSLGYQPDFMTDDGKGGTILVEVKPDIDTDQIVPLIEDKTWQQVADLTKCRFLLLIGEPGGWLEGQLTGTGHMALVYFPGDNSFTYGSFAECLTCGSVRVFPGGVATCHRDLPSGPLLRAFQAVRDTSFGAAA